MAPKKKQEKMSLGNFLSDPSYGSWAEEMDDMPLPSSSRMDSRSGFGGERREFGSRPGLGGAERDDRGYYREQLPLPSKPPFTAHLGNLPFDITQADIEDFFSGCQVTSVRIVEDKIDRKPKGFGYVEFETLDGLKKAIELNGTQFQGRNIRVSVADPPKDRADGREFNDWTRKGPLPDLPSNQQRRPSDRGGYRQVDAASDAGSERGSRRAPPSEQGDGRVRDFGNWERKGPLAPAAAPPPQAGAAGEGRGSMRRNDQSFDRRPSPSWGEGQSQEGSRPPRREFQERPATERQPTAADMDSQWRARMKPDAPVKSPSPTPDPSTPSSPVATTAVPATRPRLNLQKRTVSETPAAGEQAAASGSDSKASPFGAARPIDTATKEKEIEEKRIALRQKKEEEDREAEAKAKADKAAAAAAAAKAAEAAGTGAAAKSTSPPANAPTGPRENGRPTASKESGKENGASTPVQGRSFEILRRVTDQENGDAPAGLAADPDDVAGDASVNGVATGDKEAKSKEIVPDAAATTGASEQPGNSTEELEDDGFITVSKPPRKGRGGRAVAS